MSPKTAIEHANRHLRRIEEDEARLREIAKGMSQESQAQLFQWYYGIVERQRQHVAELQEAEAD